LKREQWKGSNKVMGLEAWGHYESYRGSAPCFDDLYRDTLLAVLKKRRCSVNQTHVLECGEYGSENRRQCHRYADYGADWM